MRPHVYRYLVKHETLTGSRLGESNAHLTSMNIFMFLSFFLLVRRYKMKLGVEFCHFLFLDDCQHVTYRWLRQKASFPPPALAVCHWLHHHHCHSKFAFHCQIATNDTNCS